MDVVLEIADTFIFDHLYAAALPIKQTVSAFLPEPTIAGSIGGYDYNSTYTAAANLLSTSSPRSSWTFQPASDTFSFQPSEAAYMSSWDRDNMWRQALTLYAITW